MVTHIVFDYGGQHISRAPHRIPVRNEYLPPASHRVAAPANPTRVDDLSYDLFSNEEKRLLQFASVFVGDWTSDALEPVSEDPNAIEHLEGLVNKSLVVTEERGSELRYFMLETIRQYAREKLVDAQRAPVARDRHFVYFDELGEKLWEVFRSEDVLPLANRGEAVVENFRAALEWGLENHVELNLRLAANFPVVSSMLGILAEGVATAGAAVGPAKTLPLASGDAELRRQKSIARAWLFRRR